MSNFKHVLGMYEAAVNSQSMTNKDREELFAMLIENASSRDSLTVLKLIKAYETANFLSYAKAVRKYLEAAKDDNLRSLIREIGNEAIEDERIEPKLKDMTALCQNNQMNLSQFVLIIPFLYRSRPGLGLKVFSEAEDELSLQPVEALKTILVLLPL